LKDFTKAYESGSGEAPRLIAELKEDVMKFAMSFPMPGVPDTVRFVKDLGQIDADERSVHDQAT